MVDIDRGGAGRVEEEDPPEAEIIVVEKWGYFPELYKLTKVLEDGRENGYKINFALRFWYVYFKIFS